jgi:glucose-6-phosphate 1-dehydrogenase
MDAPSHRRAESMRDEKTRLLEAIAPLDPASIVRGQFRGYRDEPGVAAGSRVETYAALKLAIDNPRWAGVPFFIRAGKCLPVTCTEVLVEFKPPASSAFGETTAAANHVRFRLGPDVAIAIAVRSKTPGEAMTGKDVELMAVQSSRGAMSPYERLLGDAMKGDATLFAREDAVEAEWRIVEPILDGATALHDYGAGTWGPAEADRLMDDPAGWHEPLPAPPKPPA